MTSSDIWTHYKRMENDLSQVVCNKCGQSFELNEGKTFSILTKHLTLVHEILLSADNPPIKSISVAKPSDISIDVDVLLANAEKEDQNSSKKKELENYSKETRNSNLSLNETTGDCQEVVQIVKRKRGRPPKNQPVRDVKVVKRQKRVSGSTISSAVSHSRSPSYSTQLTNLIAFECFPVSSITGKFFKSFCESLNPISLSRFPEEKDIISNISSLATKASNRVIYNFKLLDHTRTANIMHILFFDC